MQCGVEASDRDGEHGAVDDGDEAIAGGFNAPGWRYPDRGIGHGRDLHGGTSPRVVNRLLAMCAQQPEYSRPQQEGIAMQQRTEKRNRTSSIRLLCGCARDGSEICSEHFPRNLKIGVANPVGILIPYV